MTHSERRMRETLARALVSKPSLARDERAYCDQLPLHAAGKLEQELANALTEAADTLTAAGRAELLSQGLDEVQHYRTAIGRQLAVPTAIPEEDLAIYMVRAADAEEKRKDLASQLGEGTSLIEDELALYDIGELETGVQELPLQAPSIPEVEIEPLPEIEAPLLNREPILGIAARDVSLPGPALR